MNREDVDECVMPDPDRGGGLVPSKVCSKLYPNGLYPKRSLLQKLYTKLYTTFDDADLLQHYCNATHDKQVGAAIPCIGSATLSMFVANIQSSVKHALVFVLGVW